jgi:hypothetical protein
MFPSDLAWRSISGGGTYCYDYFTLVHFTLTHHLFSELVGSVGLSVERIRMGHMPPRERRKRGKEEERNPFDGAHTIPKIGKLEMEKCEEDNHFQIITVDEVAR